VKHYPLVFPQFNEYIWRCCHNPACRRHHQCKQAPGWRLEQPEPGVMKWTTPSGRVYVTTPTVYDI
jgi:hypothetical protein